MPRSSMENQKNLGGADLADAQAGETVNSSNTHFLAKYRLERNELPEDSPDSGNANLPIGVNHSPIGRLAFPGRRSANLRPHRRRPEHVFDSESPALHSLHHTVP